MTETGKTALSDEKGKQECHYNYQTLFLKGRVLNRRKQEILIPLL